ncbi:MAG: sulfatase-like hydrolase/transferase, partial [Planctomycetota bacterium]
KIQQEPDPEKRLLLASAYHLDSAVGDIVAALDRSGHRDNTLILFSSDNGPQGSWPGNAYPDDLKLTEFNQPLPMRGKKVDVWEGGIHVPGFANWPGKIDPIVVNEVVHIVDWFPTLASMVERKTRSETKSVWQTDGVDLSSVIFEGESVPERDLYWVWNAKRNRWALRFGQWKIVKYGVGEPEESDWELFDLSKDPKETTDLAKTKPEIRSQLHQRFLIQRAKDHASVK